MKIQMNIIPILLYDKKDMLMNKICFVMNSILFLNLSIHQFFKYSFAVSFAFILFLVFFFE